MQTAGWIVLGVLGLGVVGGAVYLVIRSKQIEEKGAAAAAAAAASKTGSTLTGVGDLLAGLGSGISSAFGGWGGSGDGYGSSDGYDPTYNGEPIDIWG